MVLGVSCGVRVYYFLLSLYEFKVCVKLETGLI